MPAGPAVPDADPGPAPHQPAAGERLAVRARGADAPRPELPGAAEAAGGLPGPVPKRGPEGAEQEVSGLDTHRPADTHDTHSAAAGARASREGGQGWAKTSFPLGWGNNHML